MSTSEPTFVNITNRKIIHIDMDAFFASVEQRDHPELRGKPVAVGHADSRGVVATASYEARKFGVHSAMPSSRAKMLCPQLVFIEGRMSHYKEVGMQIREIFHRYTDLVEPISIDEAYLDVTNNKMEIALGVDVAKRIKADIRNELHLVASAGVSYNKFLAKVASDWRKPDGLCTIHPSRAQHFIEQLPITTPSGALIHLEDVARVEEVEVDVLKKPMKAEEIRTVSDRMTDGKPFDEWKEEKVSEINSVYDGKIQTLKERLSSSAEERAQKTKETIT